MANAFANCAHNIRTGCNVDKQGFAIFRASEAISLFDTDLMSIEPFSDIQSAGLARANEAGYQDGKDILVLCDLPGFSLIYAWFKPGYALPLHPHDSDCLYLVVSGNLRIGTEELGPRDIFFVPANTPYTYKPGKNGVEVVEFRHEQHFNFRNLAKGAVFWDKAVENVIANHDRWLDAVRPSDSASK